MSKPFLLAVLLTLSAAPILLGTAQAANACVALQNVVHISGDYYYAVSRSDFFREINDYPGIQLRTCMRPDGAFIEGDICVSGRNCGAPDPRGAPEGPGDLA